LSSLLLRKRPFLRFLATLEETATATG
jgi:hypothetical protein